MKRIVFLLALLLTGGMTLVRADETITVTARSTDISQSLDLKAVAKLFAEARDLEEFENMLNQPDSAFTNLDMNGDGLIDYLRVVEVGSGASRMIVIQAVLARDIYQDVATIYIEKDEAKNSVKVQIVGDEYIYGDAYIIEPVYVYRPVIYDWFWGPNWYCWTSPYYWGYYPSWWYAHTCWDPYWYWNHCCIYHQHHFCCSFSYAQHCHPGLRPMRESSNVSRRDYATAHPDRAFRSRNTEYANARDFQRANPTQGRESVRSSATTAPIRQASVNSTVSRDMAVRQGSNGTSTRQGQSATSVRQGDSSASRQSGQQTTTTVTRRQPASTQVTTRTAPSGSTMAATTHTRSTSGSTATSSSSSSGSSRTISTTSNTTTRPTSSSINTPSSTSSWGSFGGTSSSRGGGYGGGYGGSSSGGSAPSRGGGGGGSAPTRR